MTLLGLIIVLLIVGVVFALVPVDEKIKQIIYVVIIVVVVLALAIFLLRIAGIADLRLL